MITLKRILFALEKLCGKGNVVLNRSAGSPLAIVYCNDIKVMYLVKSYCGGWVCLLNFKVPICDIEPFLIKGNVKEFWHFLKHVDSLSNGYLSDFRRVASA